MVNYDDYSDQGEYFHDEAGPSAFSYRNPGKSERPRTVEGYTAQNAPTASLDIVRFGWLAGSRSPRPNVCPR